MINKRTDPLTSETITSRRISIFFHRISRERNRDGDWSISFRLASNRRQSSPLLRRRPDCWWSSNEIQLGTVLNRNPPFSSEDGEAYARFSEFQDPSTRMSFKSYGIDIRPWTIASMTLHSQFCPRWLTQMTSPMGLGSPDSWKCSGWIDFEYVVDELSSLLMERLDQGQPDSCVPERNLSVTGLHKGWRSSSDA